MSLSAVMTSISVSLFFPHSYAFINPKTIISSQEHVSLRHNKAFAFMTPSRLHKLSHNMVLPISGLDVDTFGALEKFDFTDMSMVGALYIGAVILTITQSNPGTLKSVDDEVIMDAKEIVATVKDKTEDEEILSMKDAKNDAIVVDFSDERTNESESKDTIDDMGADRSEIIPAPMQEIEVKAVEEIKSKAEVKQDFNTEDNDKNYDGGDDDDDIESDFKEQQSFPFNEIDFTYVKKKVASTKEGEEEKSRLFHMTENEEIQMHPNGTKAMESLICTKMEENNVPVAPTEINEENTAKVEGTDKEPKSRFKRLFNKAITPLKKIRKTQ